MGAGGRPARAAAAAAEGGLERLVEHDAPRDLPAFAFRDAEGAERTLAHPDFAGRGVVLNLWATWCAPCVAEMPALDRLAEALAGEGVVVLALSADRGGAEVVRPFYARVGLRHLGVWLDRGGAAGRALGARGLPTTILVDGAGRERARAVGDLAWDAPEAVAAVRRLVAPGGGTPREAAREAARGTPPTSS